MVYNSVIVMLLDHVERGNFHCSIQVLNYVLRYYSLDAIVARELVGRKIGAKLRKDLDSIHEITRVPLKSCYRQYDNIRRIYKVQPPYDTAPNTAFLPSPGHFQM